MSCSYNVWLGPVEKFVAVLVVVVAIVVIVFAAVVVVTMMTKTTTLMQIDSGDESRRAPHAHEGTLAELVVFQLSGLYMNAKRRINSI